MLRIKPRFLCLVNKDTNNRATSSAPSNYFFLICVLMTELHSSLGTSYSKPSLVPFRKGRSYTGRLLAFPRELVSSPLPNRRKQNATACTSVCGASQKALPISHCQSVFWVPWPFGSRQLHPQCGLLLPPHTLQNSGEMIPLRWSRRDLHQHKTVHTQAVYPCQCRWLDSPTSKTALPSPFPAFTSGQGT